MDDVAKLALVGGAVFMLAFAALGGLALFMNSQGEPPALTQTVTVTEQATTTETIQEQATGQTVEVRPGPGFGSQGHGGPWQESNKRAEAMCASIGDMTPSEAIHWLLANHDRYEWQLQVYEDEWKIEWLIEADDPEAAEILYYHILQMECILENGGRPRAMDPVFQLEAALKPYIHTEVEMLDDTTIRVVKTAESECAWEAIKLHAEVVKGFFESGYEEAQKIHPVPDDVLEMCQDYIQEARRGMHGHDDQHMGQR